MIAKMSRSLTIKYLVPSNLTSVPAYLEKIILSPTLTSNAFTVVLQFARTYGYDFTLARFFFSSVR